MDKPIVKEVMGYTTSLRLSNKSTDFHFSNMMSNAQTTESKKTATLLSCILLTKFVEDSFPCCLEIIRVDFS